MKFEEICRTLQSLHTDVCGSIRTGEGLWYGMASDYQARHYFLMGRRWQVR
jgi:hypothetical protein